MIDICTVHGRFQPLHWGHVRDYILPAKRKCKHLVIGITNPDPGLTLPDEVNKSRAAQQNNPLSYYERRSIIHESLVSEGISCLDFSIVPYPINFPQLIKYYVPKDALHCLTIFDEWGDKKKRVLAQNSLNTHVIFKKDISEKEISSTMVRERILKGENWQVLVPPTVALHVESLNLKDRLMKLRNYSI